MEEKLLFDEEIKINDDQIIQSIVNILNNNKYVLDSVMDKLNLLPKDTYCIIDYICDEMQDEDNLYEFLMNKSLVFEHFINEIKCSSYDCGYDDGYSELRYRINNIL